MPFGIHLVGKFDDQNGVFRRQTDNGEQPYLEVNVVFQTAHPGCQQCADHTKRYHQHGRL
jgi:Coenzyme F420-reducing hydrogenase, beta subunit